MKFGAETESSFFVNSHIPNMVTHVRCEHCSDIVRTLFGHCSDIVRTCPVQTPAAPRRVMPTPVAHARPHAHPPARPPAHTHSISRCRFQWARLRCP